MIYYSFMPHVDCQISSLNEDLNQMDLQLDNLEKEVATTRADNANNNLDGIYDTDALVQEDDDLVGRLHSEELSKTHALCLFICLFVI